MGSKECVHPTCTGEFCRRIKKPKTRFILKRVPIRKVSKKQTKLLVGRKLQTEKDWQLYLEIWEEREHKCENCGCFLGNEPLTIFFDHLLEKSKHPGLRYEKENIMLLCFQDHSAKTNGVYAPKIKENIMKICEKFKNRIGNLHSSQKNKKI